VQHSMVGDGKSYWKKVDVGGPHSPNTVLCGVGANFSLIILTRPSGKSRDTLPRVESRDELAGDRRECRRGSRRIPTGHSAIPPDLDHPIIFLHPRTSLSATMEISPLPQADMEFFCSSRSCNKGRPDDLDLDSVDLTRRDARGQENVISSVLVSFSSA
jgi:hypothetical protein